MRLEEYTQIYDKVSLPKEADERILQELMEEKRDHGRAWSRMGAYAVKIAAAAAVLAVTVGVLQLPAVASSTQNLVGRFTNLIGYETEQGDGKEAGAATSKAVYNDSGEYQHVREDAPKKQCRMDSMAEVSEALGIDLLQSADAHEQKDSIQYTPYVSKSGALNGVTLRSDFYALGDICEPKIKISKRGNTISYREGKTYRSPIMMEHTIRTDDAEGVDKDNHELDYAGRSYILGKADQGAFLSKETYEIKNLGVTALLAMADTPGSYTWEKQDGDAINCCADAYFIYRGVEYHFTGAVSLDTMKEFLEGLNIPNQK